MKKQKKQIRKVGRILAGEGRSKTLKAGWIEETELDVTHLLDCHRYSRWGKIVTRLIRAGATRITIQNNPHWDKNYRWRDNFYIFIGYVEVDK